MLLDVSDTYRLCFPNINKLSILNMAEYTKTLVFHSGVHQHNPSLLEIRDFDDDNELVIVNKAPDASEDYYYLTVAEAELLIENLQWKLNKLKQVQ